MIATTLTFQLRSPQEALELAELFEDYQESYPLLQQAARDLRALWRAAQPDPRQLEMLAIANNPPSVQ